jgi:hypothetical protein
MRLDTCIEHVDRAADVHLRVKHRVLDCSANIDLCCQVKDAINAAGHCRSYGLLVAHITHLQYCLLAQIRSIPRTQVIKHCGCATLRDKSINNVRAYETSATRDHAIHQRTPLSSTTVADEARTENALTNFSSDRLMVVVT